MMIRRISLVLITFVAFLTIATVAVAESRQYEYSGYITRVTDYNESGIGNYVTVGDEFHGSFFYDPDAPFRRLIDVGRGLFTGPLDPSTATVGPITIEGTSREVQLFDDFNGFRDMLFLPSRDNDLSDLPSSLNGYAGVIRIQLYANQADNIIVNMTLPRSLDLASLCCHFGITGYSTDAEPPAYFSWHARGNITSLELVLNAEELFQKLVEDTIGIGPGTSLTDKSQIAQAYFAAQDQVATCIALDDIQLQVEAQAGKKHLDNEAADYLIQSLQTLSDAVGCNTEPAQVTQLDFVDATADLEAIEAFVPIEPFEIDE
jgi:hypothetical protein